MSGRTRYRAALGALVDAVGKSAASGWPDVRAALNAARAALRDAGTECGCAEHLRAQAAATRKRAGTADPSAAKGLGLFAALLDGIANGLPPREGS